MKFEIKTQVLIDAPIDIVWKYLINFSDYNNWNPFIKNILGEADLGGEIKVFINIRPYMFKAIVTSRVEQKEFCWQGKLFIDGIFNGEHKFLLVKLSNSKTHLVHSEEFNGLLVRPLMLFLENKILRNFESMNLALKNIAEAENKKSLMI